MKNRINKHDSPEISAVHNDVRGVVALIGGKWKLEILWLLNQRIYRFNELRRTDDARNLKPVFDAIQVWALDRQAKKSAGV